MNNHWTAFGSLFFLLHQDRLFWLLNAPVIGRWFRYVLRISGDSSSVGSLKIDRILPNAIFWWEGPHRKAEFRTHAKFSKRLYYAFAPLWWTLHAWDWAIADRWIPELSFGFATLTSYPDADPETNTVDGPVATVGGGNFAWAIIRDYVGNVADDDVAIDAATAISSNTTAWDTIVRGIFLFDTSALTSGAAISAATLSLSGYSKSDSFSPALSWDVNVYLSNPASNTALAGDDYSTLGTTAFSSSVTYANWTIDGSYNAFALNASGISNISKVGISKFGARNATNDAANVEPTHSASSAAFLGMYYADQTGTDNDPKLVVTYTLAAVTGTATESITEADIVTGSKTIIITLDGDTFIA